MNRTVVSIVIALFTVALAPRVASAQLSVGNYSGCNGLGGSKAACLKCVGGGQYWQVKEKVCGMTKDMKKSKSLKDDVRDPPKKMPQVHTQYAKIPAGKFKIGSPENEEQRKNNEYQTMVTITRPFMMKTTEVTQGEWMLIMGTPSPSWRKDCPHDCPVGQIDWRSMLEYLNKISAKEKLEPCYVLDGDQATWSKGLDCTGYRLPTEAEWEYAARAGAEGVTYGPIDDIAWHYGNSDGVTHPVGKKKPNAFGLYDMIGNVDERVWDKYEWEAFKDPSTDPIIGGTTGGFEDEGMVRGAHATTSMGIRVADRDQRDRRHFRGNNRGFRPVRTVKK
ncbi:MAG: formylglycine-generating enzyme family protein [Kofleriaceae bacterium]